MLCRHSRGVSFASGCWSLKGRIDGVGMKINGSLEVLYIFLCGMMLDGITGVSDERDVKS